MDLKDEKGMTCSVEEENEKNEILSYFSELIKMSLEGKVEMHERLIFSHAPGKRIIEDITIYLRELGRIMIPKIYEKSPEYDENDRLDFIIEVDQIC